MNNITNNVFIDDLLASIADIGYKVEDFNFELPEDYIAREPRKERSAGRLLCVNKENGVLTHSHFQNITDFINEGDLLVFNNTRIIPSHLLMKTEDDTTIEVFVERILDNTTMLVRIFKQPQIKIGDLLTIDKDILKVNMLDGEFYELSLCTQKNTLWEIIQKGELAFPLYFKRQPTALDKETFQTIYASEPGSVSAPSAGFHFDEATFKKIHANKINIDFVTLHVGSGTSAAIHVDDISKHKMHTEWLHVSQELCELIKTTKAKGKRVIAIGTTSLRALETISQHGKINAYTGYTDIFIRPGHQFQCVDGLFTNLHLPRSTLMILISALAGYEHIRQAYKVAIQDNYRFLAYGDGMLIT